MNFPTFRPFQSYRMKLPILKIHFYFQLFAYRTAHRTMDPHLADEEYQMGWINNAISRGLSNEISRRVTLCADQFGRLI